MENLILLPEEKFVEILRREISSFLPISPIPTERPRKMQVKEASEFLASLGYPTSLSKLYKLTSKNLIPHVIYGKKLVFDRDELEKWVNIQTVKKTTREDAAIALMRAAKKKGGK